MQERVWMAPVCFVNWIKSLTISDLKNKNKIKIKKNQRITAKNIKESQIVFLYRKDSLIPTECLQYYTWK